MAMRDADSDPPTEKSMASKVSTSPPKDENAVGTDLQESPVIKRSSPPKVEKGDSDKIQQEPVITDLERADTEKDTLLHHPANNDDVLANTIHLEDDPSLQSITLRSVFLGEIDLRSGVMTG